MTNSKSSVSRKNGTQKSLRAIAMELGVSHTLLSLWKQGKRTLGSEVEQRYWEILGGYSQNGYTSKAHDTGVDENTRILSPPRLPFRHLGIGA